MKKDKEKDGKKKKSKLVKMFKIILILLIVIAIGIVIAKDDLKTKNKAVNEVVKKLTGSLSFSLDDPENGIKIVENGEYGYKYDLGDIDKKIEDELIAQGITDPKEIGLTKFSDLSRYIKASIITQLPDLRSEKYIDKTRDTTILNGSIRFKSSDTGKYLTYVDRETFDSYINSNSEEVMEHFTMDENGDIILGSKTEEITQLLIKEEIGEDIDSAISLNDTPIINLIKKVSTNSPISIKDKVSRYSMPVEFLTTMLIYSNSKYFTDLLASSVENTEIEIMVYNADTESKTITERKYTYDVQYGKYAERIDYTIFNGEEDITLSMPGGGTSTDPNNYSQNMKEYKIETVIDMVPTLVVTKADTWIMKYEVEYSKTEPSSITDKDLKITEFVDEEDEEYSLIEPEKFVYYTPISAQIANQNIFETDPYVQELADRFTPEQQFSVKRNI